MIRLSRKAWNNIIIFAMLLMIFLFNTTNNILVGSGDDQQSIGLLPEHAVLMTLESNGIEIQRIGTGWRVNPNAEMSTQKISNLVTHWQQSTMSPTSSADVSDQPVIVVAWLAGMENGLVYQFHQNDQDVKVQVNGDWFVIENANINDYVIPL